MKILRLADTPIEKAAREAAAVLTEGGLVIYPTDTLYGLAAAMFDADAISLLHMVKGRDDSKFLSFIVPDLGTAEQYAYFTPFSRSLAEKHLPGPLTLVLPARENVPASIAVDGAVRIRIPDDPFALTLARELGVPYTATSANRSGLPTQTNVEEILEQFGPLADRIGLVIDDGPRDGGAPSTVVRLIDEPEVVREGAISSAELGL